MAQPSYLNIARQWLCKHIPAATYTYAQRFLCSPCHVKYTICSERKVGNGSSQNFLFEVNFIPSRQIINSDVLRTTAAKSLLSVNTIWWSDSYVHSPYRICVTSEHSHKGKKPTRIIGTLLEKMGFSLIYWFHHRFHKIYYYSVFLI
jgi:hypothetical protein